MPREGYALAPDRGRPSVTWVRGSRLVIKVSADETGGRFSQVEAVDPHGWGTPFHIHHNEDETLYVVDGELTAFVAGVRHDVGPGEFLFLPRGVEHAYVVRSARARTLLTYVPGGWERYFVEYGHPGPDFVEYGHPGPDDEQPFADPETLATASAEYGTEVVGEPPALA